MGRSSSVRQVDQSAFRLADGHDLPALAARFREQGRIRLHGLLQDPAELAAHLSSRTDWKQVLNAGEKLFELDRDTRAGMSVERLAALDAAVYAGATEGFQFRYESIRVPDDLVQRRANADPLTDFAGWLSTGDMREFLRTLVGNAGIMFADAQATRFGPGDFLTGHDDAIPGKRRIAAYVFGMTPVWRLDWGGLLLFHPSAGDGLSGLVPSFNTLDVFRVPVPHSVSLVSPAAPTHRVSVTGWLRA